MKPTSRLTADQDWRPEVAEYLADCAAAQWLSPRYHPTVAGALKVIFTRTKEDMAAVKATFAELSGLPDDADAEGEA